MSLTDFDNQINKLIVELIPYLFENKKLTHNGLTLIKRNEKLNKLVAANRVSKETAFADKQKMVGYLNDMIKYAEAQKTANVYDNNSNMENAFDDLITPKTI